MLIDVQQILTKYGTDITSRIQQNLASTGTDASGETSRSLRFTVTQEGTKDVLRLYGRPYFMTVETGRKPTPEYTKPSFDFVKRIQSWLVSRGKEMGLAYAIAKNIHKFGTKLWQRGGRKDIVSNVINDSTFQLIEQDFLKQFVNRYIVAIKDVNNSK